MRNILLFDLDGTLTDSGEGILNSVRYALRHFGIEEEDNRKLRRFIGPPLKDSFLRFYGFSDEEGEKAVSAFREYFSEKGIKENQLYPGIKEGLKALHKKGFRMGIASSKPEIFVEQIVDDFQIRAYFEVITGSLLDGQRVEKADVLEETLKRFSAAPEEVIMIGDREHDVLGAAAFGIPCVGALYGYGGREELEQAGATWLLEHSEDLAVLDEICGGTV